jgi:hypothetical protein
MVRGGGREAKGFVGSLVHRRSVNQVRLPLLRNRGPREPRRGFQGCGDQADDHLIKE